MSKMVLAGVDVSSASFDAVRLVAGKKVEQHRKFDNTAEGRVQFLRWLTEVSKGGVMQVCLESTGVYSLDLAMLLHRNDVEVMVVNPRTMSNFREASSQRNKTDREDAFLSLQYLQRMDFVAWCAPSAQCWELRQMGRRIADLVHLRTQEKNRLHAAMATQELVWLIAGIEEHIGQLDKHIEQMRGQAYQLIKSDRKLARRFNLLMSVVGIGKISAIHILGELSVMPEGMGAKQWVAWAGLDPIQFQSGSSVHKPPKISRRGNAHLRHALYMPSMCAARWEPHLKLFYDELLGRGKKKMQSRVAVMRKLLHAIFGMFKHDTEFNGSKVRAMPPAEHESRPESSLHPIAGHPDEVALAFKAGEAAEGLALKASATSPRMVAKGRNGGRSTTGHALPA